MVSMYQVEKQFIHLLFNEHCSSTVAGVKNIIMTTPPGKDGKVTANTLVAAKEAGATKVYKVGGAQAIAAMAFGTESIPKSRQDRRTW